MTCRHNLSGLRQRKQLVGSCYQAQPVTALHTLVRHSRLQANCTYAGPPHPFILKVYCENGSVQEFACLREPLFLVNCLITADNTTANSKQPAIDSACPTLKCKACSIWRTLIHILFCDSCLLNVPFTVERSLTILERLKSGVAFLPVAPAFCGLLKAMLEIGITGSVLSLLL